jgi:drug/metabolite transporter (DMT)-like permease
MAAAPHRLAGIGLVLCSVLCFAALDTTTKWVSASVPVVMALFLRYLVQALVATATLLPLRGLASLRTRHPRFHLARGLLLILSSGLAFLSLSRLPVGEFTAVVMVTPLLVTLMAARLWGERVAPLQWLFVAGGFLGTLLIVRPGSGSFSWVLLLPLALVLVNTGFQLLTSHMAQTEEPLTLQFYTAWVGTFACALPLYWAWSSIHGIGLWLAILFMGLASSLGHLLLIWSFQQAPASTLMPFMYAQIAFGMLGGWLVFAHRPDALSVGGMLLIAASGVGAALFSARASVRALESTEH